MRRHLLPAVLVPPLLLGVPAPAQAARPAPDGTLTAALEYGYPHPNATDCTEAAGTAGCTRDRYGFWQGQCTSWVAYRVSTRNGVDLAQGHYKGIRWGNAGSWGATARSHGIRVDQKPAVGAIAWYQRNPGHVAYVEKVDADGSLVLSEMNYDNHNGFRLVRVSRSYRWPTGFIHIKDLPATSTTTQFRVDAQGRLLADRLHSDGRTTAGPVVGRGWQPMRLVTQVSDVTGDARPDLVAGAANGDLWLYASTLSGVRRTTRLGTRWGSVRTVTDAGHPDGGTAHRIVVAYTSGQLRSFRITPRGLTASTSLGSSGGALRLTGVGDVTGDGRDDVLFTGSGGRSWLRPGTEQATLGATRTVPSVPQVQAASHQTGRLVLIDATGRQSSRAWNQAATTTTATGRTGHRLA